MKKTIAILLVLLVVGFTAFAERFVRKENVEVVGIKNVYWACEDPIFVHTYDDCTILGDDEDLYAGSVDQAPVQYLCPACQERTEEYLRNLEVEK